MKIALLGYGKMGQAIEKMATQLGHQITLKVNSQNRHECSSEKLRHADVAIEFSRPEVAFEHVAACLRAGVPVVSGTTAWLERLEEAKAICAAEKGAFFYASNFSIGVNLFFALSQYVAKLMGEHPEYEVSMKEVHHTQKVDFPSGTAITLAEGILKNLERKKEWAAHLVGTESFPEKKEALVIGSEREEGVPGTHHVQWSSEIDTIELIHTAHSREGFAKGALQAAGWLIGKQGFFGMQDMLG